MPRCRYCGERILFALLPGGHQIPYDPEPHPSGSLVFEVARTASGEQRALRRVVFVGRGKRPESPRYLPHKATCSARAARRRRRGGRHAQRVQRHLWEAS
jgi:hypothetical protein